MWLFALPALLINVCIILIPALLTLAGAFFFWDGIGTPVWAGLANFQNLFDDPVFWSALASGHHCAHHHFGHEGRRSDV